MEVFFYGVGSGIVLGVLATWYLMRKLGVGQAAKDAAKSKAADAIGSALGVDPK